MTRPSSVPTRRRVVMSGTHSIRPEELRGRSTGIFALAGFGLLWASLTRLDSSLTLPVLATSVAVCAALVLGGLRVRRAAAGLPPASSDTEEAEHRREVGRRFGLIVGGEWVLVGALAATLHSTGHPHLIPAVICAAVGLHFVPLAAMFHLRLYYGTAGALVLVGVATMVILPLTGVRSSLWNVLPGLGAAVSLWVTGALLAAGSMALAPPTRSTGAPSRHDQRPRRRRNP